MREQRQRNARGLRGPLSRLLSSCGWLQGEGGSATLEVALIVSILGLPLILGTAEIGFLIYDSIEVSNAAYVGALYGMQSLTFASETSAITAAAQAEATDFGTALSVTPTTFYACSLAIGGTQYTGANAQANATAACTGGTNHALEFIQVNTSVAVTPPARLSLLPSSFTLKGSSVMEVQ